jgi:2-polyprenyl-3-methyl-5-hydroxy-6-metoxy-1,4-benzoquinol methylase
LVNRSLDAYHSGAMSSVQSDETISRKRTEGESPESVQAGNQSWWTDNAMTYDWHNTIGHPRYSQPWFDAVDAAFIAGARLFASDRKPFDRVLPVGKLRGKRVLEIGCGMGLHTELLAREGANVTSIDLTTTAVEATNRRLALKGLAAKVFQADAEKLPFEDASFDFVWSWGVIHHSARTARIVRHIARVLTPEGSCRVMVYNREGMSARVALVRDHVMKGRFLHQSFDETLWRFTDGFTARHYIKEQFEDLFRAFFDDVSSEILGQESDALPLPGPLRRAALRLVSESYLKRAQGRRGSFIFLSAAHPS